MGFWDFLRAAPESSAAPARPLASIPDGGTVITTAQELEAALRDGPMTGAGVSVTADTALRDPTIFGCVRLITGAVANMPFDVKRRLDGGRRVDATDLTLWRVLRRRPNPWQKPAQFKRMMQAHVLLRGNAYAAKTWSRGQVVQLVPLHPERVQPRQRADLTMEYVWTRKDGRQVVVAQNDMLHLFGLTLDGITGVTPITYARETIGGALAKRRHGNSIFRNGANVSTALKTPKSLSPQAYERLKADLGEFRAGGAQDGQTMILEEGMELERMALTSEDAQWIESMGFDRIDLCMLYGVPPHLLGHTDGNTRLGSSIDTQGQSFVTYALEDHLTMWEEATTIDCIDEDLHPNVYTRLNRAALMRGDMKTRWEAYVKALQWGVFNPNKVLELEDENPREGGEIYYDPPNTAGASDANSQKDQNNGAA